MPNLEIIKKDFYEDIESSGKHCSHKQFSINNKIYDTLNCNQLEAVKAIKGYNLINAGSGSGKTKTLTHKVAYMLENNIKPENILLLTFTNNAANEMRDRIYNLLNINCFENTNINVFTFHAFAVRVISDFPNIFELNSKFSILDNSDTVDLIKHIVSIQNIKQTNNKIYPDAKTLNSIFSYSNNTLNDLKSCINKNINNYKEIVNYVEIIYKEFEAYKEKYSQFTFDDLLLKLLKVLTKNQKFKELLSLKYKYILVDEYQDTNKLQNMILNKLTNKNGNLTVVGDEAQSIYSFRGADYRGIINFPKKYTSCSIFNLNQNYRSSSNILNFTNEFSKSFKFNKPKKLFSNISNGFLPELVVDYNQKNEALSILKEIGKIQRNEENNFSMGNIAIIFRDTWQSNHIQMLLNKNNIPYKLHGGLKFNERKHIKDILAYLKVKFNPSDKIAWHRILRLLPGVGEKTSALIIKSIVKNNSRLLSNEFKDKAFYQDLFLLQITIDTFCFNNFNTFFVDALQELCNYYITIIKVTDENYEYRTEDIKTLLQIAEGYRNINCFLADFALNNTEENITDKKNLLTLSTAHSAKGMEWEYVFVIHLMEGYFPSSKAFDSKENIEEEKRLFYVACTRAKKRLFLTAPLRINNNSYPRIRVSSFIKNIPTIFYKLINNTKYR